MYVFDLTMAAGCATRKDAAEILSSSGFAQSEGHLLSAILPELAKLLVEKGYSRKEASNKLIHLISTYQTEDATLYIYACFIFGQSEFTFSECVTLAYCYETGDVAPAFANKDLLNACLEKVYRFDVPGERDPD